MGALYGTDLDTLSPTFGALTDDGAILRQWVELQLDTRTGIYWSAPETGIAVSDFVNAGMTDLQLAAVPGQIEACLQDERIALVDVTTTTTFLATGEAALRIAVNVKPKAANLAPFTFTAIATASLVTAATRGI